MKLTKCGGGGGGREEERGLLIYLKLLKLNAPIRVAWSCQIQGIMLVENMLLKRINFY